MVPDSPNFFQYHAFAHAFGARFTRPFEHQIDSLAPSALPPTGGHGCSRVDDFRFREYFSFRAGYTHVSGSYHAGDKAFCTIASSVIEGLNMLDVITADRVVSRVYSKHHRDAPEGHITMHGSTFDNLKICGQLVTMKLDFGLFEDVKTYEQAQAAYQSNDKFKRIAHDPMRADLNLPEQKCGGAFLCSLVEGEIPLTIPGVKTAGHSVYVPGFGRVYFAEVFISHGTRTLTMLRFELGSTTAVDGSAASATTNGKQWPPP